MAIRSLKIAGIVCVIFALLAGGAYYVMGAKWFALKAQCIHSPFKITDPAKPGFDPAKFDFNDYSSHEELASVLKELFPKGTSRQKVEDVLVEAGGSGITYKTEEDKIGGYGLNHRIMNMEKLRAQSETIVKYGQQGCSPTFGWTVSFFITQIRELSKSL